MNDKRILFSMLPAIFIGSKLNFGLCKEVTLRFPIIVNPGPSLFDFLLKENRHREEIEERNLPEELQNK